VEGRRTTRAWHVAAVVENIPFGADHRLRKQVETLLGAGHRVSVVTMRDDANASYRGVPDLRLLEYPPPREPGGPLGYVREYLWSFLCAAVRLGRLRLRGGIDVVQLCQPPDIYFPLARVLRWGGARIVVDQRDLMPEILADRYPGAPRAMTRVLHLLERRTQRVADRTLTVNQTLRDRLIGAGAHPDDVSVVVNGPVLSRVVTARCDPELRSGDQRLVVWVGKMGLQDRVDLMVTLAATIVHDLGRRDCRFVLLGDGECLEALRRQAAEAGLDECVQFTGWVPEAEVFRHLASADVGVDTSLQEEVTPVKALEYMAFGLPFACFDLPETRRLADGAAVLVPPADVAALARAVVGLIGDEGARARLGAVGRRTVSDSLAWERQSETYLAAVGPVSWDGPSGQPSSVVQGGP
jgi:glycosyltransferase involved in cell wall biosynthesis